LNMHLIYELRTCTATPLMWQPEQQNLQVIQQQVMLPTLSVDTTNGAKAVYSTEAAAMLTRLPDEPLLPMPDSLLPAAALPLLYGCCCWELLLLLLPASTPSPKRSSTAYDSCTRRSDACKGRAAHKRRMRAHLAYTIPPNSNTNNAVHAC
jgi:hypothetical protein